MGAERGLLITSPLSYLSHKPLLWLVNVSSGTPATTEQVILLHPLLSPSCPQWKTSQCTNRIDPALNLTLQPFYPLRKGSVYYLTCTDGSAWRRKCYARLDRTRRKGIRAWARNGYSLIYNWQCFSVEKPALICCLITDFHHHVQIPPRGFCGLFARCLRSLYCKLAFQKGTSPSGHSLQHTRSFFSLLTLCLSTSASNNLQLTFKPLWII